MFDWFDKRGAEIGLELSELGLLIFAALVAIGLIGEYKKERDERWKGWSSAFERLVIIGVIGEVVFDGFIFGFSGRLSILQETAIAEAKITASASIARAGEAYSLGGAAHAIAAKLERESDLLKKENLELQSQIAGFKIEIGDREINSAERALLKEGLKGRQAEITLVRIDLLEADRYADKITKALTDANAIVKPENEKTSRLGGVLVCLNTPEDSRVLRALQSAKIEAKPISKTAKERPRFCDFAAGSAPAPTSFFTSGAPDATQRGTVVFVGQKIPKRIIR